MNEASLRRVGYVTKRYPRYSETFVVNEILAHEKAGWDIEIFSLLPPTDTHFQSAISEVRAPLTCLSCEGGKAADFWNAIRESSEVFPELWSHLGDAKGLTARDVQQALLLARLTRTRGIEHLHAHFASAATTVTRLAARFAGVPYSFTAHAKDIFHEQVRPGELEQKLLDAAAVVTVSDFNVAYLRELYGSAAARVRRVYNGLDLRRFPFHSPRSRPRRVVAIGRLVEKKGFHVLIEACAELVRQGEEFECEIIGTGEQDAALRHQIAELELGKHVRMPGPLPSEEVVRHIQSAAVMAAPCIVGQDGNRDGLPTVLLEAMALGTPCVSTDVTGIPEVLRNGDTGLLVAQSDAAALAGALKRLLDEDLLRVKLASNARRLVEAEFDIHTNARSLREVFLGSAPETVAVAQEVR